MINIILFLIGAWLITNIGFLVLLFLVYVKKEYEGAEDAPKKPVKPIKQTIKNLFGIKKRAFIPHESEESKLEGGFEAPSFE